MSSRAFDVAMLNLTEPRRSPIKITQYVYVLDGGTIVRRFVSFRAPHAADKALKYMSDLSDASPVTSAPSAPA